MAERKRKVQPKTLQARGRQQRAARLPRDVTPRAVDLEISVDPERSLRYRGRVRIALSIARTLSSLELHAVDLTLRNAEIHNAAGKQRGRIAPDTKHERARISFPQRLPIGEAELCLDFTGTLRSDLRGFYVAEADDHRYAFTQLEATDARRFFPCFDEPDRKARFTLHVMTAAEHAVVSNSPIERTETHSDGRKTVHFLPTPPLSTYLIALAVGALEASRTLHVGKTPIRIWHTPRRQGLADFGLHAARECLARLERYFALPYPYAKLDLVAVPDFEFGAMENAGAVFFRETLLLLDLKTATLAEKKRAAEVICHELAHMWYGNLVTMAWWDDLWLNEAFATWMAFSIVDRWQPSWRMWLDFEHHRAAALGADALQHTHPIYTRVESASEAAENFDLITYEKGAAVVRMLERYLGAAAFRNGVRRYIRRHRGGNATAADLWRALEEASGQPVARVAQTWIEKQGFPLVRVELQHRSGRSSIVLQQEIFSAHGARRAGRAARWPIPWIARVVDKQGRTSLRVHLLMRARDHIALPRSPRFVYGNAEESSFLHPLHADELVRELAAAPKKVLPPIERMGLVRHLWALVHAGYTPLETLLLWLNAAGAENDADVLLACTTVLARMERQLVACTDSQTRNRFRSWVVEQFGEQLLELGWDPAPGESDTQRLRRAAVIRLLGEVVEWEAVQVAAEKRCLRYLEQRTSLDANLVDTAVSLAAYTGDRELYERFQQEAERADTPQEKRRFRMALADFRAPRLIARTLRSSLSAEVSVQDCSVLLARLLGNPAAREPTWAFAKKNWKRLAPRMPALLVARFLAATPELATETYRRDVARFFRAHPLPEARRSLQQALERFALNAAFRRRALPALQNWLAQRVN